MLTTMDLGAVSASRQIYAKSATPIAQPKIHLMSMNTVRTSTGFLQQPPNPNPVIVTSQHAPLQCRNMKTFLGFSGTLPLERA